jgi:hypothetical protein
MGTQRLAIELRMFSGNAVVAFEARKNGQLSSHRIASRPLRKRCPLLAVSSFSDSFSAGLSDADERADGRRCAAPAVVELIELCSSLDERFTASAKDWCRRVYGTLGAKASLRVKR